MATYCPVCDRPLCGHRDPETTAREARRNFIEATRPFAATPLDLGVSRFAADVAELLAGRGVE